MLFRTLIWCLATRHFREKVDAINQQNQPRPKRRPNGQARRKRDPSNQRGAKSRGARQGPNSTSRRSPKPAQASRRRILRRLSMNSFRCGPRPCSGGRQSSSPDWSPKIICQWPASHALQTGSVKWRIATAGRRITRIDRTPVLKGRAIA